jgi:pimeloyl-ACP methyl ester carboxylesterase
MIRFNHSIVEIEGLNIHFIHEKSSVPGAIPVLLLHGWPGMFFSLILAHLSLESLCPLGSFDEFGPVIKPLTQQAQTSTGRNVSFDVIVPSLPGFTFSSAPPANWTVDDTARIFNTLMVDVLGYKEYTTHGTDWVNFFLLFFML